MSKKVKIIISFVVSLFVLISGFIFLINIIQNNSASLFKNISFLSASLGIFFAIIYIYIINYIVNKDVKDAILLNKNSGVIPISLIVIMGLAILSISIYKIADELFIGLIVIFLYILYDVGKIYINKIMQ